MATEDKTVKVTEEYTPDGNLTKKTKEYPPKKTISDWIAWCAQVLAAGAVIVSIGALAVGIYQFKAQQSDSAQMQATQVAASAAQTLDQEHQATLVGYIDEISNLVLMGGLQTANPKSVVLALAEARTFAAVRNLDGLRKGTLVRFLLTAGLISRSKPIIIMSNADLSGADFTNAELSGANLPGANLSGADFTNADLRGANLKGANLSKAIFTKADLSAANGSSSSLSSTNTCASLEGCFPKFVGATDLSNTDLIGADLSNATNLNAAVLSRATYNTKARPEQDNKGKPVYIEPTQWPQGFNPAYKGVKLH